jgi:glycosyltransferase involved in cell wall biosynthesis
MIVVGDACTDDTEEVVLAFGDPRIRFFNRSVNAGEQATPNNDGVRLARGNYVAFLNHDDLWTPDHLLLCVEAIERLQADLVWTLGVSIDPDGTPNLVGAASGDSFEPYVMAPGASSWLVRREAFQTVGPWRPARELYLPPSQDWIHRAWQAGLTLRPVKVPTLLVIYSLERPGCYAERQSEEHERCAPRLAADPQWLLRLTAEIAARHAGAVYDLEVYRHLRRAFRNVVRRACVAVGIHPGAVLMAIRFGTRGGFVETLRKKRGLPPLPRVGDLDDQRTHVDVAIR